MALRSDSYGSVDEIRALTRHLLDGRPTFDMETRPTLADVEKTIDRVSGELNAALAGAGFTTPITNSTAKLACDGYVVKSAVWWIEASQRGAGYSEEEGSRLAAFRQKGASAWVKDMTKAFQGLGLSTSLNPAHGGLMYTGLKKHSERLDPENDSYEQPKFRRGQFDTPGSDT